MLIISTLILLLFTPPSHTSVLNSSPSPTPWPQQFHSILIVNVSASLQLFDLWYDWPNGRNFNIMRDQLGDQLRYDLEWDNGTSFYYTLDSNNPKCKTLHFEVGILRPDWLDGANYLGQERVDGFLCNAWEKVDFIWYYEDVVSKRPLYWRFYTGMSAHVMTFEVGATLEDAKWQAPVYCFGENNGESSQTSTRNAHKASFRFPGGFLRENLHASEFDKMSL
ncbi:hypothetical protein QQ045_006388 [Rhodiola kirilowii]